MCVHFWITGKTEDIPPENYTELYVVDVYLYPLVLGEKAAGVHTSGTA